MFQPTLLREGSFLVQSRGTVSRQGDGSWAYQLATDADSTVTRRLTLLPNTMLTEIMQVVEASHGDQLEFEITGEVYAYRGRNYLLATHAPRLAPAVTAPPATAPTATAPASQPDVAASPGDPSTREHIASASQPSAAAPPTPATSGDTVQDIKQRLRQAVGPVPSAGLGTSETSAPARTVQPSSEGEGQRLMREGSMITNRRGRLARDPHGAWTFIFDADANGLADPPMVLLPCLLLERLESYSGRLGSDARLLMTGRITVFGTQNYLIPTAYTIPRERTKIDP